MQRREFLTATAGAAALGTAAATVAKAAGARPYKRIATEEGWTTEGILAGNAKLAPTMKTPFILRDGPTAPLAAQLLDIDAGRIAGMDRDGVDMQLLLICAPGVQQFTASEGTALARDSNDQLAAAIRKHPTRFIGLTACAPQDPQAAAREIERGINTLKLNGVVINSHTNNEFLSEQKYWPILEAIEALDAALYIHPRDPAAQLSGSDIPYMTGAGWAYGVEVGTHVMHMIAAGVFDRFPKLRIVIGHGGEALPNWMPRIDNRYLSNIRGARPLKRLPSEYILNNIWITTSGMNYEDQVQMCIKVMGLERVMYAIDYPFEKQGEAVGLLEKMSLSEAQKVQFCERTARKVFKIGGA
jgi:5-carboxyvanillate decarboxylase